MPADNAAKIDLSIIKLSFYGGQCWSWVAALDQHVTIGTYNIAYWYIQCKKIIRKWNAVLAHVKTYVGITNY
jgi:hypothetical protein|tara:strand:- start:466 stop:681 length:216 start_codon:yes stop_codon:yes gene_type:complete